MKIRLTSQVPDIKSTLAAINCLKGKKDSEEPLRTQFMLSDQVFVNAKVPATDKDPKPTENFNSSGNCNNYSSSSKISSGICIYSYCKYDDSPKEQCHLFQ